MRLMNCIETVNGTVLLRVGKRVTAKKTAYMFVLFVTKSLVDRSGRVVGVWDLANLDPMRDALLGALDAGTVCVNVDLAQRTAGETNRIRAVWRCA